MTEEGMMSMEPGEQVALALFVEEDAETASKRAADLIGGVISACSAPVLALPAGRTPIKVFEELVRQHGEGGLSFQKAHLFQLDEWWPLAPDDPVAFRSFLETHLLKKVDVNRDQVHFLEATASAEAMAPLCAAYERAMVDAGGLDLAFLGLGSNGHVAFNEPGSAATSRTRLVDISLDTLALASRTFEGCEEAPTQGVTMGIETLAEARQILLLATGSAKAHAAAFFLEGPVTPACPASLLRNHPGLTVVLDKEAAEKLTS